MNMKGYASLGERIKSTPFTLVQIQILHELCID